MKIFVYIEHDNESIAAISREALGAASALGGDVTALVFGSEAEDITEQAYAYGASAALASDDETFDGGLVEATGPLVVELVKEHEPDVLLAGGSIQGRDLTNWVAFDVGAGLIPDATDMKVADGRIVATHPVYAGKLRADATIPSGLQIISLRGRAFAAIEPNEGADGDLDWVDAVVDEDDLTTKIEGMSEKVGGVSLSEASKIVSGGRGVGGPEGFEPIQELANAIGAAMGASRATVDAGWIPYEHQVGQTGKVVSPDLYVACGISGAIQHQAGMSTSKVIVAINKDAEAPIFKLARYGVVGDLFEIVPALTAEFKERLA